MPRKHIEFIQSADVPQKSWVVDGLLEGAKTQILSFDTENGSSTEIVEWTQHWKSDSGYFNCDMEIFVLSGQMQIGQLHLGQYTYGFIPEGVCMEAWSTQENTTALWMPSAEPIFIKSLTDAPGAKRQDYIPSLNSYLIPWSQTLTPGFPPGAMRKTLRADTNIKRSTWLIGLLPQFAETFGEYHPMTEEGFVLQGSMKTQVGLLTPGCYFSRPPLITHAPAYTETGLFALIRGGYPHLSYHAWEPPLETYYPSGWNK
ncbi:MAG: DUF4437 domain-containing protein [Nostoc sp.]|uniref:DUF4437 domain-containing protein n=1 Tax=Nostoc sp. TaxID=1180 RepID=UPI002FF8D669